LLLFISDKAIFEGGSMEELKVSVRDELEATADEAWDSAAINYSAPLE
jgi:hypothetical protein